MPRITRWAWQFVPRSTIYVHPSSEQPSHMRVWVDKSCKQGLVTFTWPPAPVKKKGKVKKGKG